MKLNWLFYSCSSGKKTFCYYYVFIIFIIFIVIIIIGNNIIIIDIILYIFSVRFINFIALLDYTNLIIFYVQYMLGINYSYDLLW